MSKVKVYGADWCPLTTQVRDFLDRGRVQYDYIDIDGDKESAKWVAEQNGGKERKPTLNIDGDVLTVPTNEEVAQALKAKGIHAAEA